MCYTVSFTFISITPPILLDLKDIRIILASKSPRRQDLLRGIGIDFEIRTKDVDESFPDDLKGAEIPEFLSRKKADAFQNDLGGNELVITSDTVVWLGDTVFNKPESEEEAIAMIASLSGKSHDVITGVCLTTSSKQTVFSDVTKVYFAQLQRSEIEWYVKHFKPYDKAGAYGIQEWIGYIGIVKIEGSFYNVMGLPTQKLYVELKNFLKK